MREDDFDSIPLEEARDRWLSEVEFRMELPLKSWIEIPVDKSVGRVTATSILAAVSAPSYYSAVCDGIIVKSSDTHTASSDAPLKLKIGKDAYFVDTGSAIPSGFDAVLPVREVNLQSLEEIILDSPVTPWKNVRPIGEDMDAREVILGQNRLITPLDLGALIAGGVKEVPVRKKPKVGILPMGTNLISAHSEPEPGKLIDFRSPMVQHLVDESSGEARILAIIAERLEDLMGLLKRGLDRYELLIIIGGPSWETKLIKKLLFDMGELIVGSLNMHPGSSICLGILDGKPVIGLPAHPVSIYLGFELFARPVINKMLAIEGARPQKVTACLSRSVESQKGVDEFLKVNLGEVDDRIVALPLSRDAAVLRSLIKADGIIRIPASGEHMSVGQRVQVQLMPPARDITKNILMTGTYDICIDILKNQIDKHLAGISLHSANIGSIEGLIVLKAGLAHICGVHAFDEAKGEFNIPIVREIMGSTPLALVNLFHRKIGFLVHRGNPRKIKTLEDLTRENVIFVNRQKGSGTRRLFDYYCARQGISPTSIRACDSEARTHISSASIITSGLADVGLGILPAAKAFKLDFIPLFLEPFDLVIPRSFLTTFVAQIILTVAHSPEFKKEVELMGGYDLTQSGTVTYEQGGCLL
jgi:putative molybdopterin biosynthesis protein